MAERGPQYTHSNLLPMCVAQHIKRAHSSGGFHRGSLVYAHLLKFSIMFLGEWRLVTGVEVLELYKA